jgi:hypothetical protein
MELKNFLSQLPASHLENLDHIERVVSLGPGVLASSSPWGAGEEIRLTDEFYSLKPEERNHVFLHEMGHNYYDFKDEKEGKRSILKWGPCKRKNVASLLRVQWMELGLWELEPENWEKIKALTPRNEANRDKYTYMVMYKNPNAGMSEWICPQDAVIKINFLELAFRYSQPNYSPKEEMADTYSLFHLRKDLFQEAAKTSEVIQAKYNFTKKQFEDNSKDTVNFITD